MRPAPLPSWTKSKPPAAKDPISDSTRARVHTRSGGRCEVCQDARANHLHHRLLRRHGRHGAENLLAVCSMDHRRIHGRPAESYELGYLVRSTDDPALTPVAIHGGWWFLLPDGGRVEAS